MKNKSEAYIQTKLRDHQEYLGYEEHRRKTLIMSDLYQVQQAYEDGYMQAVRDFNKSKKNELSKKLYL